jgi:hypothetical protein
VLDLGLCRALARSHGLHRLAIVMPADGIEPPTNGLQILNVPLLAAHERNRKQRSIESTAAPLAAGCARVPRFDGWQCAVSVPRALRAHTRA